MLCWLSGEQARLPCLVRTVAPARDGLKAWMGVEYPATVRLGVGVDAVIPLALVEPLLTDDQRREAGWLDPDEARRLREETRRAVDEAIALGEAQLRVIDARDAALAEVRSLREALDNAADDLDHATRRRGRLAAQMHEALATVDDTWFSAWADTIATAPDGSCLSDDEAEALVDALMETLTADEAAGGWADSLVASHRRDGHHAVNVSVAVWRPSRIKWFWSGAFATGRAALNTALDALDPPRFRVTIRSITVEVSP